MTRLMLIASLALGIGLGAATVSPAATPVRVPRDVQRTLASEYSIAVADVAPAAARLVRVRPQQAIGVAKRRFPWNLRSSKPAGWMLAQTVRAHLVRLGKPPKGKVALNTAPLQVGDLAWLVVVRNAEVPVLGPPGGSYVTTVAVLVEPNRRHAVLAVTA